MFNQLSIWEEENDKSKHQSEKLPMQNAEVIYYQNFFDGNESNQLFVELYETTSWNQEDTILFGKQVKLPRLTAWYGDTDKSYSYSKITMQPFLWTPVLINIKSKIESFSKIKFNSVLLNLYRDGKDSVAWHSDDEPELGENPIIASVSFGANRRFTFRHKIQKELNYEIQLTHGSLLMMKGTTQHFWQHQIPKTNKLTQPRINLTFRQIK
ncbi:MAG: alpha-ketoglutarate-dependent dioxygenase AlkB [Nostoc sp. DedQUE04]|uniref:alpha-ketoglutarate-dependent dioxygenase AlkB family protein n=1 Tax=Nostoc sp. DedQUE04 TaxID=3075390 RepID=UPI002AD36D74|nr:alpha-ketoglutarate-dependent dioxygenase AlkB [Nostoc sp. DedQUE04]MDZ8136184.1 alpha-ketoglutarate-dependent dioxygenase AlkB [Nostoc sp. DedQUE04]